ncbi:MAG: hypothetical protein K0S28_888 [Paucimonas sp.]|nr:hypothetical protein [Paucimonas sp.]
MLISSLLLILTLQGIAQPAAAQDLPNTKDRLQKFFKTPQFGRVKLSPDQRHLAVTTAVEGRMHLAVVNLETRKVTPVAGYNDADIWEVNWINNNRLVFDLIDRDPEYSNSSGNGLFAVNLDGSKLTEMVSTVRKQLNIMEMEAGWRGHLRYLEFVAPADGVSDDIIVVESIHGAGARTSLIRMSTVNARKKQEFAYNGLPGMPEGFVLDASRQLRVALTRGSKVNLRNVWYRDTPASPWKKLAEVDAIEPKFQVIGFGDDSAMYVSAIHDGDKQGIFKYDFAANKPGELIAADTAVDVDDIIFERRTNRVLGVRIMSEPPRTVWFDAEYEAIQQTIDSVYPDRINLISGDPKSLIAVHSYSAHLPGEFALYDPAKKRLEHLFKAMPWINPEQMTDQLIFEYKARDGLTIPAYLTVPRNKPMKSLPLVVMPHGGPWTRSYWGFHSWAQFLADLGYVVLQPQFRGSTGYGKKHFQAGWKQWGLAMQDDVTDGVKNLVAQGIVDSKRVCIMGASYGGYSAMMGLVKDPDLYRCGINLLGPTELDWLFTKGMWHYSDDSLYSMNELIGDRSAMKEQFHATSPSRHADKIKAPVLMVFGAKDRRVPLDHGERMRDALKEKGKAVEWIEMPDEEHGITKEENRYKVFGAIETFLKTHNPAD